MSPSILNQKNYLMERIQSIPVQDYMGEYVHKALCSEEGTVFAQFSVYIQYKEFKNKPMY